MIGNQKNYFTLNRRVHRRRVQRAYATSGYATLLYIYIYTFFKTLFRTNFSRARVLARARSRS